MSRLLVPIALAVLSVQSSASAEDWPQWRGPARDGVASSATLPAELPAELTEVWSVQVGEGHSGPVVVEDTVYQFVRQEKREVLLALDLKTGRERWGHSIETRYQMNPAAISHGKGPKSTPVVTQDLVCVLGISGIVRCFERESGRLRWRRAFFDQYPPGAPDYGAATSPLVLGELLIVHVGGTASGALSAFRLDDGSDVWSWEGDAPAYASPVALDLDGVEQLVTQTREHIVALAVETGELLWQVPFETDFQQNIVTPVVHDGLLIVSGLDRGVLALRPTRTNSGEWRVKERWRNDQVAMYMSSPVVADAVLYGHSHRRQGQLFALDAATGKKHWTSEGRVGDSATLVLAGDRLLVLTTDARLLVVEASREDWRLLASWEVADSPTWAHLAVVDDGVLVKDETQLTLLRFR